MGAVASAGQCLDRPGRLNRCEGNNDVCEPKHVSVKVESDARGLHLCSLSVGFVI